MDRPRGVDKSSERDAPLGTYTLRSADEDGEADWLDRVADAPARALGLTHHHVIRGQSARADGTTRRVALSFLFYPLNMHTRPTITIARCLVSFIFSLSFFYRLVELYTLALAELGKTLFRRKLQERLR